MPSTFSNTGCAPSSAIAPNTAKRGAAAAPGEWRHTDLPADRPEYFDRPREERLLVRRKTWTAEALTPEEAEFDLAQLDYDFYLFRDLRTGWDALIERTGSGIPRLTYAGTPTVSTSTVEEVIERLD